MMLLYLLLALINKTCAVLAVDKSSGIIQDTGVKTATVGDTVTLQCSCLDDDVTYFSWYQQSLDSKPHTISTLLKHNTEADIYDEYKERFDVVVQTEHGVNNLMITGISLSDSAMYYCGISVFNGIEFGQGVFLHVKSSQSNIHTVVHQPVLEPLQQGDSMKLSCTVYAEPCAGERSLYWIRHGASQPAVLYPSEGQCTSLPNGRTNCSLNLTLNAVRSSDAGTYYCAVASCGEVVIGDGTEVQLVGSSEMSPLLVYCLAVAMAVSTIVLLVLAFILYKLKKSLCSACKGTASHLECPAASGAPRSDADSLHYAALDLRRSGERHTDGVCVYSTVKCRKQ
ncbi:uncharacterized protein LOC114451169 [Parambassis ranga]|uniref:Uncharacterized protein LOC114451169 n=1 Tax=Parambassis ranga TaxID=210632 RepID=A0A6P7KDS8_9TELE|nr:uncharacterized protein LOC114451169 [Parambassis ranga]